MPSAITLPTFYEREKLLYQKLNSAMDAINSKFAAGVGAAEISWPLTAGGNLDMSIYNIVNGRQIWGFVNANEYDSLDDAITAAGSGGVVLVPPETTIVANGASVSGTGTTIIGSGPSSVLQLTGSASSGYLLRFNSVTRGMLANLTIDGNSSTGSSQEGVRVADCTGMVISNVYFRNFSGPALKIQGDTSRVSVLGCQFDGGSEEHIYATQCDQLAIVGCHSDSSGAIPIRFACASAAATLTAAIGDTTIDNAGSTGVSFVGYNSVGTTSPGRLWMTGVGVTSTGGTTKDGIIAGTSSAVLESVSIVGCLVRSATAGGILVNANYGVVSDNSVDNPTTFGIDLDTSRYVSVRGNYIYSATIGVDVSAGQTCMVEGNILRSCTTPISYGGTNHVVANNIGASNGYPYGSIGFYYNSSRPSYSGTVSSTVVTELSIPAGVLKQGSHVRVTVSGSVGHDGSDRYLALQVNSQTFARAYVDASTVTDYIIDGYLYISSFTDQEAHAGGWGVQTNAGPNVVDLKTVTGVDCTSAIAIEVLAQPGTTNVARAVVDYAHAHTVTDWG